MTAELRACYERANPRVYRYVELSTPDVGVILRRASDQFFTTPPLVAGSMVPAGSLSAQPAGGLHLTPTVVNIATVNESDINGGTDVRPFPLELHRKGMGWTPNPAFVRGTLRSFSARVRRTLVFGHAYRTRWELQIYRAVGTPGVLRYDIPPGSPPGTQPREVRFTDWTFQELLSPSAIVPHIDVAYDGNQVAWVTWPLENWGLLLENVPPPGSADVAYQVNEYLFVVTALDVPPTADDKAKWLFNNAVQGIAGVGTFRRVWWERPNPEPHTEWKRTAYNDCPAFKLDIDGYTPAGGMAEAIYTIDLGRVPVAESQGRIVFEASKPSGTTAELALSTFGSGGPFIAHANAAPIVLKQQTYHIRLRLTPDAALRSTPVVNAFGLEFRIPHNLSHLSITRLMGAEVDVPLLKAAIGEGEMRVIKPGARDYQDPATDIASAKAPPTLEADVFLATDHPGVAREHWLHLNRATVSNRQPGLLEERFTLLSYLRRLKVKIPRRKETVNTVHRVLAGSTALQLIVTPNLIGTTTLGNEYDGAGYYIRVRKTASTTAPVGYLQQITGNTGVDRLDFADPLPDILAVNDEIEVHSARFTQPVLSWVDADPADVWWELLTVHVGITPDRLGMAGLGRAKRSGLPPTVLERAPGDAATQAKLKVTRQITDASQADQLIDELSFIMQGVTVEIAGQFVFRQVYPMRGPDGQIIIPVDPVARLFLPTDYVNLATPTGLEARASVCSCDYGVNSASAAPDANPASTVFFVDADALAFHTQQDLEHAGTTAIPDDIAAWLWNSTDSGQYLASLLCQQVVLSGSTGLRVWPWTGVGAGDDPTLVPGDTVELVTDQYTDYDPATKQQIRGWFAYRMVLVAAIPGLLGGGTHFRGFMLGLPTSAQKLAGGPGELSGAGAPIDFPSDLSLTTQIVETPTGGALRLIASYTPPATPFLDHVEYAVRTRRAVTDDWSASDVIPGTGKGADFIKADYSAYHEVTATAVSSGGNRLGVPQVRTIYTGPPPVALPIIGAAIREPTRIRWPLTYDENTKRIEVWYREYANGGQPSSPVSHWNTNGGTKWQYDHHRDDLRSEIILPLGGPSSWLAVSLVFFNAWDDLNAAGEIKLLEQGATPAVPPDITTIAQIAGYPTSTEQRIRATMPGSITDLDYIQVYRDGVAYGSPVARTAGAGATQDLIFTGLTPDTTYAWKVKGRSAAGSESANFSNTVTATQPGGQLPTPTISLGFYNTGSQGFNINITPGPGTPGGVTYRAEHNTDGAGWEQIETSVTETIFHHHEQGPVNVVDEIRVRVTKSGWSDSNFSNIPSRTIPRLLS